MTIEQIGMEFKRILQSNRSLSSYNDILDEGLIFADIHLPDKNLMGYWMQFSSDAKMLTAYFNETSNSYQIVLFKIVKVMGDSKKYNIEILEISELYHLSSGPTLVRLLEEEVSVPLRINYSQHSKELDHFFLVELDLDRLIFEFPRLVERIADAIVFLGEVLLAGGEE
ncbi:hypothetical protein KA005_03900 [bacterium]|nr:hypothetical protein [bacterium]